MQRSGAIDGFIALKSGLGALPCSTTQSSRRSVAHSTLACRHEATSPLRCPNRPLRAPVCFIDGPWGGQYSFLKRGRWSMAAGTCHVPCFQHLGKAHERNASGIAQVGLEALDVSWKYCRGLNDYKYYGPISREYGYSTYTPYLYVFICRYLCI